MLEVLLIQHDRKQDQQNMSRDKSGCRECDTGHEVGAPLLKL